MRHSWLVLLVATVGLAGCASSAGTSQQSGTAAPRRDTNLITADELATVQQGDLYSAVQQLRPSFLQTRGPTSTGVGTAPEVLQVYVNGVRTGDVSALRQLQAVDVKEVRRLSATEATQRYGTGHTMGAILVTRK
jgi:hypothetical protein